MPRWMGDAACRGLDTGLFFEPSRAVDALEVCGSCPVVGACADYAKRHRVRDGVFGGVVLDRETSRRSA